MPNDLEQSILNSLTDPNATDEKCAENIRKIYELVDYSNEKGFKDIKASLETTTDDMREGKNGSKTAFALAVENDFKETLKLLLQRPLYIGALSEYWQYDKERQKTSADTIKLSPLEVALAFGKRECAFMIFINGGATSQDELDCLKGGEYQVNHLEDEERRAMSNLNKAIQRMHTALSMPEISGETYVAVCNYSCLFALRYAREIIEELSLQKQGFTRSRILQLAQPEVLKNLIVAIRAHILFLSNKSNPPSSLAQLIGDYENVLTLLSIELKNGITWPGHTKPIFESKEALEKFVKLNELEPNVTREKMAATPEAMLNTLAQKEKEKVSKEKEKVSEAGDVSEGNSRTATDPTSTLISEIVNGGDRGRILMLSPAASASSGISGITGVVNGSGLDIDIKTKLAPTT